MWDVESTNLPIYQSTSLPVYQSTNLLTFHSLEALLLKAIVMHERGGPEVPDVDGVGEVAAARVQTPAQRDAHRARHAPRLGICGDRGPGLEPQLPADHAVLHLYGGHALTLPWWRAAG